MKNSESKLSTVFISILLILNSCGVTNNNTKNFYAIYSQKLGVQLNGNEDKKFIKAISDWKGTPYRYGGTSRKGTDCSGFVSSIYKEVYNKNLHRNSLDMLKDVKKISKKNLKTGDLIFFKTSGKKVSHVGIYIADNKFIHAASKGVVINDLDQEYYKKAYYKSGKVKM
ncbi:MAG: C40 family peptidase [Bacteroidales bacterium]|nr:C40 family peptidase [Bacteroidales bacterium]MBN2756581.1 C40 family peptidase [Bacteroidales bacterium]